jgi:hypothetical protein
LPQNIYLYASTPLKDLLYQPKSPIIPHQTKSKI